MVRRLHCGSVHGSMGTIRRFRPDDLPEVAGLWAQAFHKRDSTSLETVQDYFHQIFLGNPWYTDELPSLVYEDSSRRLAGFLGVVARPMTFLGERIQVAVASQLMVDKGRRSAFAPIELLRCFFRGPQDLSFSDGANTIAQKVWQAAGGSVAMLYSPCWTRLLRPAAYVARACEARRALSPVGRIARPLCWAVDAAIRSIPESPFKVNSTDVDEQPASTQDILACAHRFSADRALQPAYDTESLEWLLRRAAEQQKHGELYKLLVRDRNGEIQGWYINYVRRGGVSQVLQMGANCRWFEAVLSSMFRRSLRQGAVAVSGQLDPKFALELANQRCSMKFHGYGVLVQSRSAEILNSIHRGDAFLTRLDGEWWMRFCDFGESD